MQIYEYKCLKCENKFEMNLPVEKRKYPGTCPRCSGEVHLVISRFVQIQTERDRMKNIETQKIQDKDYYRDERNVGLRAKNRISQMGYNLGDKFKQLIDQAKTSTSES
ncbi:MAG: FmdB family zinc ribbon protein [Bacillota bacterium]